MKQNPCPYETCVDHKKNRCDSHQIEACVKLRMEYAFGAKMDEKEDTP